ncbi:MAG: aldo/keto reductase [Pseudonocardiaceae bacterium]
MGSCGLEVSALGVGCWALGGPDTNLGLPMGWDPIDDTQAQAGLERAYTLGATLFDTADVYGHGRSERLLGQLVDQVPRASLVLSSKVGYFRGTAPHGYHPVHLRHQLEQSLDNLRTDYLDIYFFHHSEFGENDELLDATIETMRTLRTEGLVRAIGMRGPHRFALERLDNTRRRPLQSSPTGWTNCVDCSAGAPSIWCGSRCGPAYSATSTPPSWSASPPPNRSR